MKKLPGRLLYVALALVLATGCVHQPSHAVKETASLRIAAASDLKFALDEVVSAFVDRHPEISVATTYGASGNFYAQILNRAPFDLYLSADVKYPLQLVEKGMADRDSVFVYSRGQLVIWVPTDSPLDIKKGLPVLRDERIKKIATANPKHAPYGQAAQVALEAEGIYEDVASKLVLGENVSQAAQFIESGAADVGIIALSLAESPVMKSKGRYQRVHQESYPPLEQGAAILTDCKNREAAEEFCDFLQSSEGQRVLHRYGFETSGD
jgi:molybdate transport system substrate-binding protein